MLRKQKEPKRKSIALSLMRDVQGSATEKLSMFEKLRMIRKTEQENDALSDYSFRYPAFKGELPFDLTFTFLGKSVTRKAKVVYEHTPEWPYYDLRKQAVFTGWESSHYHIELAAVPEVYDSDDTVTGGTSDVPSQAQSARLSRPHADRHEVGLPMDRAEERAGPEDVGQQALMRGLDTAFPFFRLGLSRSEIGRRSDDRPHRFPLEFPCRGPALTPARLI